MATPLLMGLTVLGVVGVAIGAQWSVVLTGAVCTIAGFLIGANAVINGMAKGLEMGRFTFEVRDRREKK